MKPSRRARISFRSKCSSGKKEKERRVLIKSSCLVFIRDLEAASALIDPERKDSLLLSLNKKVELLDSKLKEIEIDHAQKIALGMVR